MRPDVSVIIPTYNRSAMLREAIESVLAQRGAEFEFIVVDDGSTDDTPAMLEKLSKLNSSIRLEGTARRGAAAARNRGVELARTPLITFLDSDDLWAAEKLARQLDFMRRNSAYAIAQSQETWIRDGRRVNPGLRHLKRSGDFFAASLRTCLISLSATIMRTQFFREMGGFDATMAAAEDYDLWLRILIDHEVGLLDEYLVTRRGGHRDQLSSMPAIDRFRILALMKLLASDRLRGDKRIATSEAFVEKCRIYSGGLRRRGYIEAADFYDRIAINAASTWLESPDEETVATLAEIRARLARRCARPG
jgi:glycosyltransferase involved in cell wall biosynthesis